MNKFFDIIPPGEMPPEEVKERKKELEDERKLKISGDMSKSRRFIFLIILIGAFVLTFGASAFLESRAKIEILPRTERRTFETKLAVSSAVKEIDASKKIIPGEIITAQSSISQEFPSTGTIEKREKARGTIRVYNNYSSYQILVATTRFLSSEGKLFRSLERVYIPAGQYKDVPVVAAEPGKEYNIAPTTFSIPGLAGSPRYTVVYGKSFSAMKGGEIAEKRVVSQDDLDNAQKFLEAKVIEKVKKSFAEKLSPEMVVLPGSEKQEIIETSPLARVNQEVDSFVFQMKAKGSAFVFYKTDIANFIEKYIASQIQPSEEFLRENIEYDYSVEKLNLEEGNARLNVVMTADVYSEIDKNKLKELIKGKSKKEIEWLLKEYPEIGGFKITFFPFWVRKCPDSPESIDIIDKFE